jgi:hypothetical protein
MTSKQKKKLERALARARVSGTSAAKRLVVAVDAALVAQGKAARARQRKRAFKAALRTAGRTALLAGAATATVFAARAVKRARQAATES